MSDNIVILNMVTNLDIPVERVITGATEADLEQVIILGFDKDGAEYFASSVADGAQCLWLMERAKKKLLDIVDE